jgi:hypothetical protein
MKTIFLLVFSLLFILFGAYAEMPSIWIPDNSPPLKISLETNGWIFFQGYTDDETGKPPQAFLKLIAVKGKEKNVLSNTKSLEGYFWIKTEENALEFVRLFTNFNTQYLFRDADWIELKKKSKDSERESIPGYIEESEFEKLKLFEPRVTRIKKKKYVFVVERCLLNSKGEVFQTRETVWENGAYNIEIVKIIAKETDLQYPFYE